MMDSMIKEDGVTFKSFEQEVFRAVCKVACELTKEALSQFDEYVHETRDKSKYRDKGIRTSSIKTRYGTVTYDRHVYQVRDEYGVNHYVYLLDENLKIEGIGLISENVVDTLISSVTEMSYRNCSARVTEMTGLPISHTAVWNIIQKLGNKLEKDEEALRKTDKEKVIKGKRITRVLFEEADGVWINIQGKDRKERKYPKAEMKAAIAYDGWKSEGQGRYSLDGKVVTAGFERGQEFQKTREAMIAAEYDLDEVDIRLLNGDGGSWIKKPVDKDTVFQLDPFHRNKSVHEKLHHPKAVKDVMDLLETKDIEGVFEYLETYRNSLSDEKEIKDALDLIRYFQDNRNGLLSYQERGIEIPESPDGLVYRNMGTMENHIWSIIARRMKHNHTSWSLRGGNHLAKILAKKCSGKLYEATEQLKIPVFEAEKFEEIQGNILSAGSIRERIGRGYEYPVTGHYAYANILGNGNESGRYWE